MYMPAKKQAISKKLLEILACPACKSDVKLVKDKLVCQNKKCGKEYPIEDGIPVMLPPELRNLH